MFIDNGAGNGVRSLAWYCQRVAINHIDSICSVEGLPFPLIKCILEACPADTLLRLEQTSPTIQSETNEVWRKLCENTFKQFWSDYELGRLEEPKSWKATFFELREQEAEKFRQLGAKLRNQRVEHEQRRREKEVKYSGLLPPPKRQRTSWSQSSAPKTLFEKARSKTAQMQKGVYAATRILPPMPQYKNYSTILPPRTVSAKPPPSTSRPSVTNPTTPTLSKIHAPAFHSKTSPTRSKPSPVSSSSSSSRSSSSGLSTTTTSPPSSIPSIPPTPSTSATTPSPVPQPGIITVTKIMVPKPAPRTNPPLDTAPKTQRYIDPVLPQLARKYARRDAVMREHDMDKTSTSTLTQTVASGNPTPKPPPPRKPDTVLFMPRQRTLSQIPRPAAR